MVSISNSFAQSILTSLAALADAGASGAVLRVYNGTMPVNLDTALSGNTLLAQLTMSTTAFNAPTDANPGATMSAAAITDDSSADASGTPTFCRILDSNLNPVMQLTAAVGSGEVNFGAAIVAGQPVQITSLTVNMPEI